MSGNKYRNAGQVRRFNKAAVYLTCICHPEILTMEIIPSCCLESETGVSFNLLFEAYQEDFQTPRGQSYATSSTHGMQDLMPGRLSRPQLHV